MRERLIKFIITTFSLLSVTLLMLLYSCSDEKVEKEEDENDYLDEPVCVGSFIPKNYDYEVVGFYPYYRHDVLPVSEIQWEKITRIIYAFAKPNANGTLNTSDLTMLSQLKEEAHANGVEVYFSVGGGGSHSDNFPLIATPVGG